MPEYASRHLAPGDRSLRRDFRLLGWQLRRLVRLHGGASVWQAMRQLRALSEQRQQGEPDAESEILKLVATMPVHQLASLTRAIGLFFDMANLAEDRHRVRVLHQRQNRGRHDETLAAAGADLRATGMSPNEIRSVLRRLEVEPVFTAHPTEAKRRSVRRVLRRLRRDLYLIDRSDLPRAARRSQLQRMQRDLLALWCTDPVSPRKPTVIEELRRTIYAVRTLWHIGPSIMQKLRHGMQITDDSTAIDRPLRFGSWIGGDRDGNPFVTSDVTRTTLAKLRATAIALHRRDGRAVRNRLTISAVRCPLPPEMKQDIEKARLRWPRLGRILDTQHPDEWIVQWLIIIDQRLRFSHDLPDNRVHSMAYPTADALAADIDRIRTALVHAGYDELTTGSLRNWADRVRIFGLHLLNLDIRINSIQIADAMDQLLDATGSPGYRALDDAGRHRMLAEADAVAGAAVGLESLTPETADLMRTLTLTQRLANAGESRALGQLIVSMTHQPTDVLAVVWLLKVAALRVGMADPAPLPVVPLFETIDDLHRAHVMFDALLDDPHYRQHVRRGGERMTCMLGYSDSAKDGGYLASNWALYQTQDRLASRARDRGVTLTMFHGRGGALGRGGGPAARAIISLPSHAVDGRLRITEQGEVIAERYDDPSIAQRHLEQLLWATLRQSYSHHNGVPADAHQFARHMADLSLQAYRKFVESPHFADYLRQCTALPLIEKLPIGSRPSRRTAAARLEDLRAIPFTFAWNQVRMPINAFYGLGSAFEALDPTQKKRASELYKAWPWFRAVIDNAELALARCDPAITRRYAQLGPDQTWAMELWQMLCNEFEAARRAVLAIKQESDIIEAVPWLQRTIRIRNPYLDLLNLIQVELMSRLARETAEGDQRPIDEALRLTVQSIAAGLRNTG